MGLIPGSGRSPGGGHGYPLQYLVWTEEPGGLQSMGSKESNMTEATEHIAYAEAVMMGFGWMQRVTDK